MHVFSDRREAGALLAQKILDLSLPADTCVFALPRGGLPVALEITRGLGFPLDMLFIKKISAPGRKELALGAVGEAGVTWNEEALATLRLRPRDLSAQAGMKKDELELQIAIWRPELPPLSIKGQTAIVVDDGIATGATMSAALLELRRRKPRRIIVAAPVASAAALQDLSPLVDDLVILQTPRPFLAVGQWYRNFEQVTDDEMRAALSGAATSGCESQVFIPTNDKDLPAVLTVPRNAKALVIFACGSGSSHASPRNVKTARTLNMLGVATLLFDLLTEGESQLRSTSSTPHYSRTG